MTNPLNAITITLPLNILGGAEDFSPKELRDAIFQSVETSSKIQKLEEDKQQLKELVRRIGGDLEALWQIDDQFEKAQAIRKLIENLKVFGR